MLARAAVLALAAGALAASAAASVPQVTIRVIRSADPGTRTSELNISGTIASGAAGETVDVQAKECGPSHRFYRLVGGATTIEGGGWQLVTTRGGVDLVQLPINAYFRARWRGNFSAPVLARVPAFVTASWRPRRRLVDVSVWTGDTGQDLRGRFVELQRKVEGTDDWVPVRRARLGRASHARFAVFSARFSVPTPRLTLRAFVPAKSAAPCFTAAGSAAFTS
jgi:hypothetical protein